MKTGSLTVQDVIKRWNVSRPTVMLAIKERRLIGQKLDIHGDIDSKGKWFFPIDNVIRWRQEPRPHRPAVAAVVAEGTTDDVAEDEQLPAVLKMAYKYIESLQDQLKIKDEQLAVKDTQLSEFQLTMRDQLKLLTYADSGIGSSLEQVAKLQNELDKKDIELKRMSEDTAEKVIQLLRQRDE